MFSFEGWRLLLWFGRQWTSFMEVFFAIFDLKKKFQLYFFNFWSSKPEIRIGIRIRIHLQCWIRTRIRIRIRGIQIHNTASKSTFHHNRKRKWMAAALPDGGPAGVPADVSAQVALLARVPAAILWGSWNKNSTRFFRENKDIIHWSIRVIIKKNRFITWMKACISA